MRHIVPQPFAFTDTLTEQMARRDACAEWDNITGLAVVGYTDDALANRLFLPPYQLLLDATDPLPVVELVAFPSDATVQTLTLTQTLETIADSTTKKAAVFAGAMLTVAQPMAEGARYYLRLTVGTKVWYSEIFAIHRPTADDGRGWPRQCNYGFVKMRYQSDCHIDGVISEVPTFYIYLDTEISQPEYLYVSETDTDGYGEEYPVFRSLKKVYGFSVYLPEYLIDAVMTAQLFDSVVFEAEDGTEYVAVKGSLEIDSPVWENGCAGIVRGRFATGFLKKACC